MASLASDPAIIGPEEEVTNAFLHDLFDKKRGRRKKIDASVRDIIKYLAPWDAHKVRECRHSFLRWHDPKTSLDKLGLKRCNSAWCGWCPHERRLERTRYIARRMMSIDPDPEAKLPRLFNLVAELPQQFHTLALTDPRILPAFRKAARITIAGAYEYEGKKGVKIETAAWKELGAIAHMHAWGDKATPWPKPAPHLDILLAGHRRHEGKIEALPDKWPEPYRDTRARYREALRKELTPICMTPNRREDLLQILASDFDVIWHVSRTREKNEEIHTETAPHRIWYSTRPLFELARCRLINENGRDALYYQPTDDDAIIHRLPPGPVFEALRTHYPYWAGREVRRHWGILHGEAYADACALAAKTPVYEQEPSGKVLITGYKKIDGRYEEVDPREVR